MAAFFTRLRNAWLALLGRVEIIERRLVTDAEAELLQQHARLVFALRYLKDLPMALSDDITALGTAIQTALAAKDAQTGPLQQQVSDLTNQVAALNEQLTAAAQQVQSLTASITPAAPAA